VLRRFLTNQAVWMVGIGAVALLARWTALSTAYDIFIDEVTYTNIAANVAHGHGVTLYGQPFALHPPAAFGLYALAIMVFGLHGGIESVLFSLRHVDVVIGSATCVLTFVLVGRAASKGVAAGAALLVALDPLAITYDSRVMLEAPAQLAAISMVLLLAVAADGHRSIASRHRWLGAAGLAGAVVLCTKETFGLVVVLALVCLALTGWVIARREALAVLGLSLLGYAVSVLAMGLGMGFGVWWHTQIDGVFRLIGTRQITGFNAPQTHVTFISRVLADGSTFAVTYLILGFGMVAALGLLWRLEPWRRRQHRRGSRDRLSLLSRSRQDAHDRVAVLIAVWTISAACYLVYATLLGTIEEQMYYILLLPSVISLCLWFAGPVGRRSDRWRAVGVVLICVALAFSTWVWVGVHSSHDNEYRRLLSWEAVHVPPTAVVAATDDLSQFLLPRGVIGQWNTVPELQRHHVDFVVINVGLVDQGYGLATQSFERTLERRGRVVFEANGTSDISLRVYDVRSITDPPR
jgi:hypothetical protein